MATILFFTCLIIAYLVSYMNYSYRFIKGISGRNRTVMHSHPPLCLKIDKPFFPIIFSILYRSVALFTWLPLFLLWVIGILDLYRLSLYFLTIIKCILCPCSGSLLDLSLGLFLGLSTLSPELYSTFGVPASRLLAHLNFSFFKVWSEWYSKEPYKVNGTPRSPWLAGDGSRQRPMGHFLD